MKKIGLTTKVFIGFIVGVILGIVFQEKILFLKIVGDIFLSLIKMLVVPLVFFSIISGITNITDIERLKRVGTKIVGMYFITTLLSAFLGLGVGHLIQPGKGFVLDTASALNYEPTAIPSVTSTILSMFPTNIIQSMAAGDMMPIIVFCAFFGVAMTLLGDKVKNVRIFINESTEIMYRMTAIVMEASPYGVCALMACTIGQYGLAVFGPLGKFIFCDYFSCAIIVCVMYFLILKFMGKIKFSYFMRKILPLWAVTASTTSSSGSLLSIGLKQLAKITGQPMSTILNFVGGGATYICYVNGSQASFSTSIKYPVLAGGLAVRQNVNGTVKAMIQLMPMKIDKVGAASVMSNGTRYETADDMQVYLWYKGQYYATKLSEVNSEGYYLTGWYDNFGCAAGKRVRVIVAVKKD